MKFRLMISALAITGMLTISPVARAHSTIVDPNGEPNIAQILTEWFSQLLGGGDDTPILDPNGG